MEVLSTLRADTRVVICPARMQYAEEFEPAGGSAGAVFYPVCLHCAQCGFNFFQDVELLTPYFLKRSSSCHSCGAGGSKCRGRNASVGSHWPLGAKLFSA